MQVFHITFNAIPSHSFNAVSTLRYQAFASKNRLRMLKKICDIKETQSILEVSGLLSAFAKLQIFNSC